MLNEKIDLVMWTKDGEKTLPAVLAAIGKVVPDKSVNRRIIVDDQSIDNTPKIAKSYGWEVVRNMGRGISDGANTALKMVETKFFASFEQDLLLTSDWWQKIPQYLSVPNVAVASGIRFVNFPLALKKIEEYSAEKYKYQDIPGKYFPLVKTLDNTIYKTDVIRKIGGFPSSPSSVGADQLLSQSVFLSGFEWKVDYDVQSVHLRNGLRVELAHNYWYGTFSDGLERKMFKRNASTRSMMLKFLYSPVRGLEIAIKKNAPESIYIYPLLRLSYLRGVFDGRKALKSSVY